MGKITEMRTILIILLMLFVQILPAQASIVNFEDASSTSTEAQISNGYSGFTWDNFYVVNKNAHYADFYYANGTVSGDYTGFNGYRNQASVISTAPITFNGAYLTAASDSILNITIQGYSGAKELYTSTIQILNTSPTWFNANWSGVDKIVFTPFGGSQNYFAIDNFTYETSPVPIPGAAYLLVSGLAALVIVRRKLS